MRFKDRVAIVTGGGSGIGRATCELLAAEGARVAVADLNEAAAAAVAAGIAAAGGTALPVAVDVARVESVNSMVAAVVAAWGGVHVLVNNAGWDRIGPFVESEPEFWDRVIAINLRGQLACARAVLPHMIRQGYGRLVNISSDAGRNGSSGETPYAAAKGGVIAFTKSLAREVARHGIAVNCVAPGLTDTAFLSAVTQGNEKLIDGILRSIPFRRFGRPEEIARAIAFLASDDASYITGQTLSVNGGLTMM